MATLTRKGFWTFAEFCDRIEPDQKADLINGVIYLTPPEGTKAARLFGWLLFVLGDFLERTEMGDVFGPRIAFRLGDQNGPEPDLAVLKSERRHLVREDFIDGPPDLAIEIVCPESVDRDFYLKRDLYEHAGVAEYWIIDADVQQLTVLRLDRNGKYRKVRPAKGIVRSQVLNGFWLRPEWLWARTRPSKAEALKQILG